jgi:hypothetical protein
VPLRFNSDKYILTTRYYGRKSKFASEFGYFVSLDGGIFNDRIIASRLHIPIENYKTMLENHGALKSIFDGDLYFDNEDKCKEAIVSIYLILKLAGNDHIELNIENKKVTIC